MFNLNSTFLTVIYDSTFLTVVGNAFNFREKTSKTEHPSSNSYEHGPERTPPKGHKNFH